MAIEIDIRHENTLTTEQTAFIRHKAEMLDTEFPDAEFIRVVMDHQRYLHCVAFEVQHKSMPIVEAKAEGENFTITVDSAFHKAEKQLRRHREKVISQHQRN
ncbi:MAG: HPF/RaiA family ribosome-associated protein [Kiritimatiellaeota bacterium]|nr:HPF/RaiA family ribosome-associated protein [Kiritimatiellota bacterium]